MVPRWCVEDELQIQGENEVDELYAPLSMTEKDFELLSEACSAVSLWRTKENRSKNAEEYIMLGIKVCQVRC